MDKQSLYETAKRLVLELSFVEPCWPFSPEFDAFKIGGKIFMLSSKLRGVLPTNLKSDLQKSPLNQQIYPSIKPGYHTDKKHWVPVYPGKEISKASLRDLINDSWNLVVDGLARRDQKRLRPDSTVSQQRAFLAYHFISILVIYWHVKLLSHGVFTDIISVALKRHSTKAPDVSKKLTPEQAEQIKTLLQYSPSSTNSQPWRSIVASAKEGKARVAKFAADNYVFNERKTLDALYAVVFCAKTTMDDTWLKLVIDQEDADGRLATSKVKVANDRGCKFFTNMRRKDLHDDAEWMAKQVYLNVGNFLLGVTALGLDAVPTEGFDAVILDEEFDLKEKGYTSLAVVPVGHHSVEDFNVTLSKSRPPQNIALIEV